MKKVVKVKGPGGEAFIPFPSAESADEVVEYLSSSCGGEYEVFDSGEIPLEKLPESVQKEVRQLLRCYRRAFVVHEYGEFRVNAGCCIKAYYPIDHFVAGDYKAEDVYSLEERRQNYFEEFGSKPCF